MERMKSKESARGNIISDINFEFAAQLKIKISHKIGDGNFADVYRAKSGDQDIALKITYRSMVQMSTLQAEMDVLIILKDRPHQNVVKVVNIIDNPEKSQVWIMMEWFNGEDMYEIQNRQKAPFEEKVAKQYFRQMVTGLEFLHSLHIVHRDIKPHNLLVGQQQSGEPQIVKYIDFGFAKVVKESETQAICSSHKGSQIYMAPELMSDKNLLYDAFKTDIYSLAIVLYEMLFNELPFGTSDFGTDRSDRHELMMLLKENLIIRYPAHIDVHYMAKQLIEKMIECQPEKRCTLKEIAESDWLKTD